MPLSFCDTVVPVLKGQGNDFCSVKIDLEHWIPTKHTGKLWLGVSLWMLYLVETGALVGPAFMVLSCNSCRDNQPPLSFCSLISLIYTAFLWFVVLFAGTATLQCPFVRWVGLSSHDLIAVISISSQWSPPILQCSTRWELNTGPLTNSLALSLPTLGHIPLHGPGHHTHYT